MSYCRFTENSDLYIYPDGFGGLVCCACTLKGSFRTKSRDKMIAHIRQHKKNGDKVPHGLITKIGGGK